MRQEPTIHHRDEDDTSEDEAGDSSIEEDTHDEHNAAAADLAVALEALPSKATLPPKPKQPSRKLLQGKVVLPEAVKTTKTQWTGKLDLANKRIGNLENHISLSNQTTQTLYTVASTSINHQHAQLK